MTVIETFGNAICYGLRQILDEHRLDENAAEPMGRVPFSNRDWTFAQFPRLTSKANIWSSAPRGEINERPVRGVYPIAGAGPHGLLQSVLCPPIAFDFERSSPRETGNCMRLQTAVKLWCCCATEVFRCCSASVTKPTATGKTF